MGRVAKPVMMIPKASLLMLRSCMHVYIDVDTESNLVLMSPETATSLPWRNVFGEQYFKSKLCSIAVDESHCIAEW